jgi:hypothetical protein
LEAFQALDPGVGSPGLALPWVQQDAVTLLPRWLRSLQRLEVAGPYQFAVTLMKVRGLRPLKNYGACDPWGEAARDDTLLLPAWTIDLESFDQARVLRELQRLLHESFGRDGIKTVWFDPDGSC